MANKKKIQPLEDPPIASSSDGEDSETSSGEEEESDMPPADSDSGSDSDSDMEVEPPVKPAAAVDSETELFVSSYLVKSIAGQGLDEDYVKQKWRSAPVEDKKTIVEMYKILRAKEVEYLLLNTQFLKDVLPMIFKSP